MVDQFSSEGGSKDSQYKSLSADSELQSAYENLRRGEYKLCRRVIDKRMPKLKSEVDKMNFNIVKLLLLNKLKKTKDAKKLVETLKKEVLGSSVLSSNSDLCGYFKNVLRELNEEQAANEIFKNTIKNYNLTKIARKDQFMILKELTLNYEFQDLYSKITSFLKNDNDPDIKFLTLLKYEVIYILAFKYEKLSKMIVNLTLKEMLNNYSTLSKEKGFIDILVKYLISLNDTNTFLSLFENKQIEFTNAPMEDLLIDIYFKKEESLKLLNFILNKIRTNLNECNYSSYQRLINYVFFYYEKNSLLSKIDVISIFNYYNSYYNPTDLSFYEKLTFENLDDCNLIIALLLVFFEYIHISHADKGTNFNAYKSSILAKLTIFHNLIMTTQNYALFNKDVFSHLLEILEHSVHKQSILTEVSKFFIYLTEDQRRETLNTFTFNVSDMNNLSERGKDDVVFYYKLEKMLNLDNNVYSDVNVLHKHINNLIKVYFSLTSNSNKLEKGERLVGDDILILVNEYFFEYVNRAKKTEDEVFVKLSYAVYSVNAVASERSPYNYDISLFYLRTAAFLNLPSKVLEILKFMNLKGPQSETVSYIAFPCFFNNFYKPGLMFLIESFEKWESSNKKSIRKTFWKMFTGRNFWNTEELLQFLRENENSYYKHLLNFLDVTISYNDNLVFSYEDENVRKENFSDLVDLMYNNFMKYQNQLTNNKLTKNQDLVISIFKFKQVDFFNNDYALLALNRNYNKNNYKYEIDSLWKNNIIFEYYPSFKNNFMIQDDTQVFGLFEHEALLSVLMINRILLSILFDDKLSANLNISVKDAFEKYVTLSKNLPIKCDDPILNDLIQNENVCRNLVEVYLSSLQNVETIITEQETLDKNYSLVRENFLAKSQALRTEYSLLNFNSTNNFIRHFQLFKNFYLPNLTFVTSKFVELINDNKKVIKDSGSHKVKLTNSFKSPMMNYFIDTAASLESILKKANHDDTLDFFFKSLSILDEENMNYLSSYKAMISELSHRLTEEQKDHLKALVDTSKVFKNFVKENI